jgi:hypothetical protein
VWIKREASGAVLSSALKILGETTCRELAGRRRGDGDAA